MKYITVLDFVDRRVYQYEIGSCGNPKEWNPDSDSCEEYLSGLGHSLNNCEWMVHENPEIVIP